MLDIILLLEQLPLLAYFYNVLDDILVMDLGLMLKMLEKRLKITSNS